jgi:hypothetical protein
VGVTGYDVYQGVFKGTSSGTTYTATGLTAATAYTFSIKAKDAVEFISFQYNCKCVLLQLLRLSIVHHKEIVQ